MVRTILALIGACVVAVYLAQVLTELSENARAIVSRELQRGAHVISVIRELTRTQLLLGVVEKRGDKTGETSASTGSPKLLQQTESTCDGASRLHESVVFGQDSNRLIKIDDCCIRLVNRWLADRSCVLSWEKPMPTVIYQSKPAMSYQLKTGHFEEAAVPGDKD